MPSIFCPTDESYIHLFLNAPLFYACGVWLVLSLALLLWLLGLLGTFVGMPKFFIWELLCMLCDLQPCVGLNEKTRNLARSGGSSFYPAKLICTCAFLRYWPKLQNKVDRRNMMEGDAHLQQIALSAHEVARASPASLNCWWWRFRWRRFYNQLKI